MPPAAPAPAAPAASPAPAVVVPAVDPIKPPADPAAAVAPAKPAATVVDPPADPAAAVVDPPIAAPADWPADWRTKLAKGDEKALKRLERYGSPLDVANAMLHAQDRIAKGLKPALPDNATPEQVKEFREAMGIPEKPEDYKVELPNGRVVGEADKPLVGKFLADMHKAHAPPALINAALSAYYEMQDEQVRLREDADLDAKVQVEEALRAELGAEYRPNINAVRGLLAQFPNGAGDKLLSARTADGGLLFNDPAIMGHFMRLARDLNPAATLVPGSSANAQQTIADEMTALKADMANPDSDYHKGPQVVKNGLKDTAKGHRYRELVAAQERMGKAA